MARIHHYPLQPMLVCDFQQLGKDYRIDHLDLAVHALEQNPWFDPCPLICMISGVW